MVGSGAKDEESLTVRGTELFCVLLHMGGVDIIEPGLINPLRSDADSPRGTTMLPDVNVELRDSGGMTGTDAMALAGGRRPMIAAEQNLGVIYISSSL